jgi:hypothetical protein
MTGKVKVVLEEDSSRPVYTQAQGPSTSVGVDASVAG